VDISFDPAKNARNIAIHGISLERAADFDWHAAVNWQDTRRDYGERRYVGLGGIDSRVYVVVYTPREGKMHIISLRKANRREVRRYEEQAESTEKSNGS